MPFTTQIFTFAFFPICIVGYFLVALLQHKGPLSRFFSKLRATDLALIGIGCVFYMWTCFDNIIKFSAYILVTVGKALTTFTWKTDCEYEYVWIKSDIEFDMKQIDDGYSVTVTNEQYDSLKNDFTIYAKAK